MVLDVIRQVKARFNTFLDWQVNREWYDFPLGRRAVGSVDLYRELALAAAKKRYPEVESFEAECGFAIDKMWLDELAFHTQVVIKKSPLCYAHGRVLYSSLSRYLALGPTKSKNERITIWETGTARGFSAICMAKALSDQGRPGIIITFDVLPHRTPMFWNCIDDHSGPKTRAELLKPWQNLLREHVLFHQGDTRVEMAKLQADRIHFAFLDGAHTFDDVIFEFEQVRERQESGDVIVYDDYTPEKFPGLVRAIDKICAGCGYDCNILRASEDRGYVVATRRHA